MLHVQTKMEVVTHVSILHIAYIQPQLAYKAAQTINVLLSAKIVIIKMV